VFLCRTNGVNGVGIAAEVFQCSVWLWQNMLWGKQTYTAAYCIVETHHAYVLETFVHLHAGNKSSIYSA
jgi:hypothetical protein